MGISPLLGWSAPSRLQLAGGGALTRRNQPRRRERWPGPGALPAGSPQRPRRLREGGMRPQVKVLAIMGAILTARLGAAVPASAAAAAPGMDTSIFACSGSACEVGPGNVGVPFAAGLNATGDGITQSVEKFYVDDFTMK